MSARPSALRFYPAQAAMLLAVTLPIAQAERNILLLAAVLSSVTLGWWVPRRYGRVLLSPRLGQTLVLVGFAFLLVEYLWFGAMLVLAIAHFVIGVCCVKLLETRKPRDEAQVLVLCLLLLIVAAIISGDVSFALATLIVLSVGLPALLRLGLLVQLSAVQQRVTSNQDSGDARPEPSRLCGGLGELPGWKVCLRPAWGALVCSIVLGAVLFVACPRFDQAIWQPVNAPRTAMALTGFSTSMNLTAAGAMQESDRTVMRVRVGIPEITDSNMAADLCFRGCVGQRYVRRAGGLGAGWGWQSELGRIDPDPVPLTEDGSIVLSTTALPTECTDVHFWLEQKDQPQLFTVYPTLELSSRDFAEVRLFDDNQIVQVQRSPGKLLRYTVRTVSPLGAPALLLNPRGIRQAPPVLRPDPALPREEEIIRLIDQQLPPRGDLAEPTHCMDFLERLQQFLRSDRFTYTLNPPHGRAGREPIGEFLFETRQGYCEHFASAMAVICQLKGIPARVAGGYRGGEYNPVGGFIVVREKNAHSWVEAFVPTRGWVSFDPTPGTSMPVREKSRLSELLAYADFLQFHWANLVVTYDASARRNLFNSFRAWIMRPAQDEATVIGAVIAFARELFGWRLKLSSTERVLYWAFTLLVVALIVLVGYMVASLGRKLYARVARWRGDRVVSGRLRGRAGFYHRFCRRLESLDIQRRPGQTPAEFAADLASTYPGLHDAPRLVGLYYDVAFGGRDLSRDHRDWIDSFLSRLRSMRREDLSRVESR